MIMGSSKILIDILRCQEFETYAYGQYNHQTYDKAKSGCRHVWRRGFFGSRGSAQTAGL